jgi:hypothetical protein
MRDSHTRHAHARRDMSLTQYVATLWSSNVNRLGGKFGNKPLPNKRVPTTARRGKAMRRADSGLAPLPESDDFDSRNAALAGLAHLVNPGRSELV